MNGRDFYELALAASNARDALNRSSSGYGASLYAYNPETAEAGIDALERLISDRKDQIADAEYRLRQYREAVAAGGVEAYISTNGWD